MMDEEGRGLQPQRIQRDFSSRKKIEQNINWLHNDRVVRSPHDEKHI